MKRFSYFMILAAALAGCSGGTAADAAGAVTEDTFSYETQMFRYPDKNTMRDCCEVRYRVDGNTLYTSEKYHFLEVGYSFKSDSTIAGMRAVYFDRDQEPDAAGWYRLSLTPDDVPHEDDVFLSVIALRSYFGEHAPDYKNMPHINAYLFNCARNVDGGGVRIKDLTPELSKLYNVLK